VRSKAIVRTAAAGAFAGLSLLALAGPAGAQDPYDDYDDYDPCDTYDDYAGDPYDCVDDPTTPPPVTPPTDTSGTDNRALGRTGGEDMWMAATAGGLFAFSLGARRLMGRRNDA
jgi:hypothetical protein